MVIKPRSFIEKQGLFSVFPPARKCNFIIYNFSFVAGIFDHNSFGSQKKVVQNDLVSFGNP